MKHSVTIHITRNDEGSFFLTGSTSRTGVGALNRRGFPNEDALRRFLAKDLGIHKGEVEAAMEAARKGMHSIGNVMLTEEEVTAHGLGPI
jgi:hypothetical protein